MNISLRRPIPRRSFLKAGAVSIALPALNAMLPRSLRAEPALAPKRLLLIGRNLGMHAPFLFPETAGLNYETTRYLQHLENHRGKFTLFSGVSHINYNNHHSEAGLFTGVNWARIKEPAKEHHNSISLDQYAAERIKADTRYRNLVIGPPVQWNFSWNEKGVPVPSERSPTKVFNQLFINGTQVEIASETHRLKTGRSILDQVGEEARSLGKRLGAEDRERLDLMFSSIRETEQNFLRAEAWTNRPKPAITYSAPKADPNNEELIARETLWFDITRLAFQTDSTRVILLTMGDAGRPKLEGVNLGHHDASHHGKDDTKIEQLAKIEETELVQLSRFFTDMQQVSEGGGTLFDHTAILNVSNLGNASAHTCENLPVLLAGGGFKHQGHVLKNRKDNTPLSNIFVRMLQQVGIQAEAFGGSTRVADEV